VVAGARILKRAWQVYVAHMFLFVVYLAEIAYVSKNFESSLYAEEWNIFDFLKQPDVTLFEALVLKFKPVNMDVLPLYIVLLLGFPVALWLLLRRPTLALAGSTILYALARTFEWNIPAYPSGEWVFNPLAWQLLFVIGAWCGVGGAERVAGLVRSRVVAALAVAYLAFAFAIVMTWHFPRYGYLVPRWLGDIIYPVDKANLDVLRILHFLALAVLAVRFVPPGWPALNSLVFRPAILCGQHSLEIFCLGVFLAFAGHFVRVELSGGPLLQVVLSLTGIGVMIGVAWLIGWYQALEGRGAARRTPSPGGNT